MLQTATFHRKVLVVDDDPDWREYVRLSLRDLGYEALEAANGEEALVCLRRDRPDIMLLDLSMPGMDGQEVLAEMPSNRGRGVSVVLVTAASDDVVSQALSRGGQYYLPKGSTREALSLLLESLSH